MERGNGPKVAVILALVLAAFLWAAPARAGHLVCGSTVFADTELDDNLLDCPGDGLIIGADGMTLHLNGRIVTGANAVGSAGIKLLNRTGVTVKGPGVVKQFDKGVEITGGVENTVKEVTVANNRLPQFTCFTTPPGVRPTGIQILNSAGNTLKGNAAVNNCRGIAIVGPNSEKNKVKENSSTLNFFFGILIRNGAHENKIASNSLDGNTNGPGIILAQNVTENEVTENFVHSNVGGISIQGNADRNVVKENVITNNGTLGIRLGFDGPPFPIVSDNDQNEIRENIIGNQTIGVLIQDATDDANVIKDNTFFDVPTPISDGGTGTVISGNESG